MKRCIMGYMKFPPLFKPILLQFFTILQDKLYSFNIQGDGSTCFLCTTVYCVELTTQSVHRGCFTFLFVLFENIGEREAQERAAGLFFIVWARGTLRKQRVCKQDIEDIMKRVHEENSIMSELFSQNNMLLCGMQSYNSCSSHRTISVKIETFFGCRAKLCFVSCGGLFYFQHTRIAFCPK